MTLTQATGLLFAVWNLYFTYICRSFW